MRSREKRSTPPIIIRSAYQLLLYIDERVANYPAAARPGLGRRTLDVILDITGELTAAAYAPRKSEARHRKLSSASSKLTFLRLLLRAARDRRYLSKGQYEHTMRPLVDIGRMVGGWIKLEESRRTADAGRGSRGPRS